MKKFFNPTKAKIFTTILLTLILLAFFYIRSLTYLCLPNLELPPSFLYPTPTPRPIIPQKTINDLSEIAKSGNYFCIPDDPSYQFASAIYEVGWVIFIIILDYHASCTIIFFVNKSKQQKKDNVKLKE